MLDGQRDAPEAHDAAPLVIDAETEKFLRDMRPPNTPVSIKTGNTLLAIMKAEAGPNADGCILAGSVWLPSDQDGCGVHMAWDPGPRILTLIFRTTDAMLEEYVQNAGAAVVATEEMLSSVAPGLELHCTMIHHLRAIFSGGQRIDAESGFLNKMRNMTGEEVPRRIVLGGWGLGGSLATSFAPWTGMHVPTATVHCITFVAPPVGNVAFVHAFRWLVSISYRFSYYDDVAEKCHEKARWRTTLGKRFAHVPLEDHGCQAAYTGNNDYIPRAKFVKAASAGPLRRHTPSESLKDFVAAAHRSAAFVEGVISDLGSYADATPESVHARDAAYMGASGRDHAPVMKARTGGSESYGIDSESCPEGRQMNNPIDRVLTSVASKAIGATGAAPNLMAVALSALNDTARGALHTESEQLTLGRLIIIGKIAAGILLASAAYRPPKEFRTLTGIEQAQLLTDKASDTTCYVGYTEGSAYIVFRGTYSVHTAMIDVQFFSKKVTILEHVFPGIAVHTGFMSQLRSVISHTNPEMNLGQVILKMSKGRAPDRIVVIGHSLGGAVAQLAALWATLQFPRADVRAVTFGSPRVGNKVFKRAYRHWVGNSLRIVNKSDPIPCVPPAAGARYRHVGPPIYFSHRGMQLNERPWHKQSVVFNNPRDHLLSSYAASVSKELSADAVKLNLDSPDDKTAQTAALERNASMLQRMKSLLNSRN